MKLKIKWYEVISIQWLVTIYLFVGATPTDLYKLENDVLFFLWATWAFFVCLTIPISIILNALKHEENTNNECDA